MVLLGDLRPDRSHAEVFGEKTSAVRAALMKIFQWEIATDAAVED